MRTLWALAAMGLVAACSSPEDKAPTQRDRIGQVWKYEGGEGGKPKVAYIGSANSVQTMTAADTFGVLLVQPMQEGGADVTVKLVGAPFTCDLSDCKVMAITDDGKTHEWKGRMTENKDGIEILPAAKPYDAIKDGKTLKVNLVVGPKDKTFPFEFNVAGLDLKG
ncbi:hypothetical protein Sj15T_26340 [Sphingobium sp. TA15]|uniref:Uncharacterized protein n=1 Tax=Sphingobium indicum (strain DSM 16413 / CCM 7287 / MTCC 6362 / UT26 / NBRC 101211 / UT26S) TaxID=452662 RepID=D4Z6K7_SPHIU|nr:hypothetical protein [Sphingobium indicum]BAI98239.1 hypothetical protein SJA_C1-34050 [Sphingobium indicum UT26S]BDD67613.1 hypothetical protein Sj15T_26340 [Sphingobium sp. TA15]